MYLCISIVEAVPHNSAVNPPPTHGGLPSGLKVSALTAGSSASVSDTTALLASIRASLYSQSTTLLSTPIAATRPTHENVQWSEKLLIECCTLLMCYAIVLCFADAAANANHDTTEVDTCGMHRHGQHQLRTWHIMDMHAERESSNAFYALCDDTEMSIMEDAWPDRFWDSHSPWDQAC